MRKKLFALVFSLCSVAVSMAQSIKGTVVDETNNPLPFANVLLQDREESFISGTTTDNEGNFTLKTTPDATTIEISYIGYSKVQINTAQYNSDTIKMTPDRILLGEVVIRDYIPKTKIHAVGSKLPGISSTVPTASIKEPVQETCKRADYNKPIVTHNRHCLT